MTETSITKLLKDNADLAEKQYNELSLTDQAEMFLKASDQDRLRLLDLAHEPRGLLAEVPAAEVWFTVKRTGAKDALQLIKYSTPEQLQVIADIEWWKRDRLDSTSIVEWLGHIAACGMGKIMEWFKGADWDQILWFFKENIVVFKKDDKEMDPADAIEWPNDATPITFEGLYYFQVLDEKEGGLIRHLLEILVKHDSDLYNTLCEACLWEMPSQMEEEAYQTRSRRLAENGFPDFDEALEIYSPLKKEKFAFAKKRASAKEKHLAPRYPLVAMGDRVLFINRALSKLDPKEESHFLLEAASIAGKVLIADAAGIEEENIIASLRKTLGYINIGLEALSEGDLVRAEELLAEYWALAIFQVGLSEVLKLTQNAKNVFQKSWMKGNKENLKLLNIGECSLMEGLLTKRPKYCPNGEMGDKKDFVNREELEVAANIVFGIEFIGRLLQTVFVIEEYERLERSIENVDTLKLSGIFLTIWINNSLKNGPRLKPIKTADLEKFLKDIDLSSGDEGLTKKLEEAKTYIIKKSEKLTAKETRVLEKFIDESAQRFISEFRDLTGKIEARFIESVWVI